MNKTAKPVTPARATPSRVWLEPRAIERRDALLAVTVTLACLLVYASTACRTFYVGDSPEIAAAAAVFGIPHPPGYPLFTVVTGILLRALPLERAFAANLVVGVYAACAVGALLLFARRLGASRVAATVGALSLAFGETFWSQGVAIEVYGFDVLLAVMAGHAALGATRSPRAAFVASLLFGLWLGHRPLNLVYAPTLVGLAWLAGGIERRRVKVIMGGLAAAALPYLFLLLRSRAHPAINIGDPETWDRFLTVVRGAPYVRHWTEGTLADGVARLERHLLALPKELGVAMLLAIAGMVTSLRDAPPRRTLACILSWTVASNFVVCLFYHVLDINDFLLPSTWVLAVFAAFGTDDMRRRFDDERSRRAAGLAAIGAAVLLLPVNYAATNLRDYRLARLNAEDILDATPKGAVLFVEGDTNIHALWYLQAVGGMRPDVIVVSRGHVLPWYVDELTWQHPDEPWPTYGAGVIDQLAYVRKVRDALGPTHPLVATRSVPIDQYLGGPQAGKPYGPMPRGLLSELLPYGTSVELRPRADFAQAYFERAMGRLLPRPAVVDLDSASLYLEYALSMSQSADLFARSSLPELHDVAKRLFRWVLDLRPDELDERVREDVRIGLGQSIPETRLEAHARAALAQLERPAPAAVPSEPGHEAPR